MIVIGANVFSMIMITKKELKKEMKQNYQLYLCILFPLIYLTIFCFGPMYGLQIAFKDFKANLGILGSPWVGLKHFQRFFDSYLFSRLLVNTLTLSMYSLVFGFPIPIIFALALNTTKKRVLKKTVQMVTYAPYFISTIVMVGMILRFLDIRTGLINNIVGALGLERINFMGENKLFSSIYVWSGIWQGAGWGSIIYLAALASIDQQIHEAAIVDGANALQLIRYIDIPSIMPTVVIMLILSLGNIMNVGFEKVLLMQNSLNISSSEVIQTYVYKVGIGAGGASGGVPNYSFATAVGLFNSIINFSLLFLFNYIVKKISDYRLW